MNKELMKEVEDIVRIWTIHGVSNLTKGICSLIEQREVRARIDELKLTLNGCELKLGINSTQFREMRLFINFKIDKLQQQLKDMDHG